jgi:dTDP-4-amino-4,6-dideoxygalactose transaminase
MATRVGPATDRFVDFARPAIGESEIGEVVAALESGWLSTGPRVAAFERAFASHVGTPHAVAVSSCTAALHLALLAGGIGQGDEVITTPLTFCATANAILHAGAEPVFADVDAGSMNIDPAAVETAVTSRTRALLPVHFAGRPVDILALQGIARRHGLKIVEDAAHSMGGAVDGRRIGAIGDFTCFSFYATKNVTTGEGGMVTTPSAEAADWMRVAALHGMSKDAWSRYSRTGGDGRLYDVVMAGFKYNMTDIQAALGLRQLERLPALQARRRAIWQRYDEGLAELPITRPPEPAPGTEHARHLYTVMVDPSGSGRARDEVRRRLRELGVATSVHFTALHLLSYYGERLGLRRGMFPNAEYVSDHTMSIPLSPAMTDEDVEHVIAALHEVLAGGAP